MMKYLLFSPLGSEKFPTLKELTTNGKALRKALQECSWSEDEMGMNLRETLRLGLGL